MNILFEPLYSVDLSHEYLSPEQPIADFFSILPTRECRTIIRQQGLVFRQTATGFTVFYEYKETLVSSVIQHVPVRMFPEQCHMSFTLVPKLSHFFNKTNIRMNDDPPGIFRFCNLNPNKIGPALYINRQAGSMTVTRADRTPIRSKRFKEKSISSAQLVDFSISNEFSPAPIICLTEKVVRQNSAAPQGTASVDIDLTAYDDGVYTLVKEAQTDSFYASDELSGQSAFAVIDIYIRPEVPVDYRLIHPDGYTTPRAYHLQFAARHVWWKFIIVPQNRDEILASELSITSMDATINFGDAVEESLEDGSTCYLFVSNKKIPFSQKTLKGFGLVKSGSQSFSLENLSNPGSQRLIPHESFADEYYAESYIYI